MVIGDGGGRLVLLSILLVGGKGPIFLLVSWPWDLGTFLPTIYASSGRRGQLLVGSSVVWDQVGATAQLLNFTSFGITRFRISTRLSSEGF